MAPLLVSAEYARRGRGGVESRAQHVPVTLPPARVRPPRTIRLGATASLPEPALSLDLTSRAHMPSPARRPLGLSTRHPRRRPCSSPRNMHVAAAASPRPRPPRTIHFAQPRHRRDPFPRNIRAAKVLGLARGLVVQQAVGVVVGVVAARLDVAGAGEVGPGRHVPEARAGLDRTSTLCLVRRRPLGLSARHPRRRRDPSPRNIHVAGAAESRAGSSGATALARPTAADDPARSPRLFPTEYPRRGRGGAAIRCRDSSPRNIHAAGAASPQPSPRNGLPALSS